MSTNGHQPKPNTPVDVDNNNRLIGRDADEEATAMRGESTPLFPIKRDESQLVSTTRTLMNFLRVMVGPGCMSLPVAFKFSGLWTGFALMFFVAYINTHCMALLVDCAQYLCLKSGKLELDYGHLAKKVFDYGPGVWQKHSKKALFTVNGIIIFYQLGVCAAQLVFMAATMHRVVGNYNPTVGLDDKAYISILLPALVALCFIRHLKTLAIISTIGNILMVLGFVVIFQEVVRPPNKLLDLPAFGNWDTLIMSVGAILYAIEGQANVLPLENKMQRPADMNGWNGVLWTGMTITTCIFAATGFFGYGKYGDNVASTITLNMPQTWFFDGVNVMLVLSVYFGYPLQAYVIIEMLWPAILRKLPVPSAYFLLLEYFFRLLVVVLSYVVAMIVPHLELIISFVGISLGSIIAFVLPGLFDLITFWDDRWMKSRSLAMFCLVKNLILIVVGLLAVVAGLYSNIVEMTKRT